MVTKKAVNRQLGGFIRNKLAGRGNIHLAPIKPLFVTIAGLMHNIYKTIRDQIKMPKYCSGVDVEAVSKESPKYITVNFCPAMNERKVDPRTNPGIPGPELNVLPSSAQPYKI